MSVDVTEVTPPPAATPPTFEDTVAPIIERAVAHYLPQVQSQVLDQVNGAIGSIQDGHTMLQAQLTQVAADVATNRVAIEQKVATAGTAVLTNVESDPLTQRILVCSVVGAFLIAGILILGFAMLGNATANRWIAGAPIALGAAVLWVSKAGVTLPTKSAVKL